MKDEAFEYWYNQMKLGNPEAKDRIIKQTIPLIKFIIKEDYCFPHLSEDLENIGKLSLLQALETYNINMGNFNYYISRSVHWNINKFLSRQEKKWGNLETLDKKFLYQEKQDMTLHDIVYDKTLPSVEEKVEFKLECEAISKALMILPPFDKYVIELRFGFITGNPLTLIQIKDILKFQSTPYLSRVLKRSLIKIREYSQTGVLTQQDKINIRLNYLFDLDETKKAEVLECLTSKECLVMTLYLDKAFLNGQEIANKTGISHRHVNRLIKRSLEKLNR